MNSNIVNAKVYVRFAGNYVATNADAVFVNFQRNTRGEGQTVLRLYKPLIQPPTETHPAARKRSPEYTYLITEMHNNEHAFRHRACFFASLSYTGKLTRSFIRPCSTFSRLDPFCVNYFPPAEMRTNPLNAILHPWVFLPSCRSSVNTPRDSETCKENARKRRYVRLKKRRGLVRDRKEND